MTREGYDMEDATRRFTAIDNRNETREILSSVYDSLKVKGYNPINQLVGYIISEDPTYITNYNNARSLICRLDRDELLQELLVSYLGKCKIKKGSGNSRCRSLFHVPPQTGIISSLAGSAVQMDST